MQKSARLGLVLKVAVGKEKGGRKKIYWWVGKMKQMFNGLQKSLNTNSKFRSSLAQLEHCAHAHMIHRLNVAK